LLGLSAVMKTSATGRPPMAALRLVMLAGHLGVPRVTDGPGHAKTRRLRGMASFRGRAAYMARFSS